MKALILAGGFGTRLKSIAIDVPKPMMPIAGKPFLEHQIIFLKENRITDIILSVHNMADKIKSYFGDGKKFGVNITYSEEEYPLGTAGAIKKAERYIDNTFLVLNGDSYSQINLDKLIDFHKSKRSKSTITLSKVSDSSSYGNVLLQEDKIINFLEKVENQEGLVNTGIYVFEPSIFDYIEPEKKVSLENEIFPNLAKQGILWGFPFNGYFMDIGRPETYAKFKRDVLGTLIWPPHKTVRNALNKIDKKFNFFEIIFEGLGGKAKHLKESAKLLRLLQPVQLLHRSVNPRVGDVSEMNYNNVRLMELNGGRSVTVSMVVIQ